MYFYRSILLLLSPTISLFLVTGGLQADESKSDGLPRVVRQGAATPPTVRRVKLYRYE